MTAVKLDQGQIQVILSKAEALVFFEWLSRNWERTRWESPELIADPAEKQLMIWLENDLGSVLSEPFEPRYLDLLTKSYRELVPEPDEWS